MKLILSSITICFFLLSLSVAAQTDQETNAFVKWRLKQEKGLIFLKDSAILKLSYRNSNEEVLKRSNLLNEQDLEYIKTQINDSTTLWPKDVFDKKIKVVSDKQLKGRKSITYYSLSKPVFSTNEKITVILVCLRSNKTGLIFYRTEFYEKNKKDGWRFIKELDLAMH